MRSLVWTFWIAMLLAILVAFVVSGLLLMQWQRYQSYSQAQGRPHAMLHTLAADIESVLGDEQAVIRLLENNQMSRFGQVYLIDDAGADVLNRPIPLDVAAGSPAISVSKPVSDTEEAAPISPIFARAIRSAQGEQFFMIFRFDSPAHPLWALFRWFGLTWVLIASVVVSGVFSALLASVVVRPLKNLAATSSRHGDGELDLRIDDKLLQRRDEIGELSRQLATSASKISRLLQQQRDFLRDISHEVRTPLARLHVAAENVELDPANGNALAHIQSEVAVIDQLVQDLLHLSRMDRPLATQHFESIDVSAILTSCVEKVRILAEQKELTVECDLPGEMRVPGIPQLLQRAIENLLTNAIRHSHVGKKLSVACHQAHAGCHIVISDEGPGVPEASLDKIFDDFVRLDSSRQRETGGFGLGLSIVRRVAALHGGSVEAANRQPAGLEVTISLPLEASPCSG